MVYQRKSQLSLVAQAVNQGRQLGMSLMVLLLTGPDLDPLMKSLGRMLCPLMNQGSLEDQPVYQGVVNQVMNLIPDGTGPATNPERLWKAWDRLGLMMALVLADLTPDPVMG